MRKIHKKKHKYFELLLISGILVSVFTIVGLQNRTNGDLRSLAEEENDPNFCVNSCLGEKDPCTSDKIINNGENLYDSSCCGQIKSTGDPMACGNWVNRTWCFPNECDTIPADVNRQRCAGARTVYCEKCQAHKCYTPTPTITPFPSPSSVPTDTPSPSNTPVPSAKPESVPTATIRATVTPMIIFITEEPVVPTANPPTLQPTKVPFQSYIAKTGKTGISFVRSVMENFANFIKIYLP
ncbi:MAG: hypothetical protein UT63_C0008G0029 [Candidatus Gottesmanbacteria bacterium GW2011_GWC2_39_8]|uniref:Uncharacterized protein n=1 Tax=Candidatus Gottesmanbacteria bacterium GW2011_GWC2_39_8 TaxID=1618450 RepID=A0A0G0SH40_9BACT|nr:MAG: hypothetical protein UT63_C0008G0029 [Candidatus Gottesmanbacteria bacterium GW2011_GWC2_39_8]